MTPGLGSEASVGWPRKEWRMGAGRVAGGDEAGVGWGGVGGVAGEGGGGGGGGNGGGWGGSEGGGGGLGGGAGAGRERGHRGLRDGVAEVTWAAGRKHRARGGRW